VALPKEVTPTADFARAAAETVLLAVPTQSLRKVLEDHAAEHLAGRTLVACSKGVELGTGCLPSEVIAQVLPDARAPRC
jgi:glycerol-3-phosphate dehydrogenase (NAD(P)+)